MERVCVSDLKKKKKSRRWNRDNKFLAFTTGWEGQGWSSLTPANKGMLVGHQCGSIERGIYIIFVRDILVVRNRNPLKLKKGIRENL